MKYWIFGLTLSITTFCSLAASNRPDTPGSLRVNRVGYLENDVKIAVYLGDEPIESLDFVFEGPDGKFEADSIVVCAPWSPKKEAARIYFSSAKTKGDYRLTAFAEDSTKVKETTFYVGDDAYSRYNLNEMPLYYLRQQRCGYNPVHDETCHLHDGRLVLAGERDGEYVDVTGGWHDASDYLQYLPTSATTVYQLLFAYQQNPEIWRDDFDAAGRQGSNGIPDILDEAKWGLDWMIKMNPEKGLYLNQIADDRDHRYAGIPSGDNVDYGWGEGQERPVYPCSGNPYGLGKYKNESTGLASSVAKFSSAFGLGAEVFAPYNEEYARDLFNRSIEAYDVAKANPGACQTAPCVSPYYYEEDNWADDMELAAVHILKNKLKDKNSDDVLLYARMEPVTPWMGADTANHYQWYPFINLGHFQFASDTDNKDEAKEIVSFMREGVSKVAERGKKNVFLNGIPFIWCSNNLAVAFVTQAMLYRELTGDESFRVAETMVRDWLFGLNPWDQIMIILPHEIGPSPHDPHSALSDLTVNGKPGRDALWGGLVDGPIYTEKFNSLWGVHLRNHDPYESLQNPTVVYHDDYSDYSTNEPTMDGTASLAFLLGRLVSTPKDGCKNGRTDK